MGRSILCKVSPTYIVDPEHECHSFTVSLCQPDEATKSSRWIYHLYFFHFSFGRWRAAMVIYLTWFGRELTNSIYSHYTPTKAAILSLMQSCAVALGKYGIRCNAILPGTIATDINKEDLSDAVKRENMIKRTCLGRLGGERPFIALLHGSRQSALPFQRLRILLAQWYSLPVIWRDMLQEHLSLSTEGSS